MFVDHSCSSHYLFCLDWSEIISHFYSFETCTIYFDFLGTPSWTLYCSSIKHIFCCFLIPHLSQAQESIVAFSSFIVLIFCHYFFQFRAHSLVSRSKIRARPEFHHQKLSFLTFSSEAKASYSSGHSIHSISHQFLRVNWNFKSPNHYFCYPNLPFPSGSNPSTF